MDVMTRLATFLIGCIGVRAAITYLAKVSRPALLRLLGWLALLPAIGFVVIYVGNLRQTGIEVGGEHIWWTALRPVHAALLFAFSYFAISANRSAWMFLMADTLIGLAATTYHHVAPFFLRVRNIRP